MASRIATFECPCCAGRSSLPLDPGQRPPGRRACSNGGCWSCLGACRGQAVRLEVVRVPKQPIDLPTYQASRPASLGGLNGLTA